MKNKTIISIYDLGNPSEKPLFSTDSYPVVPNIGEEICIGSTNCLKTCKVVRREISYITDANGDRTVFVIIWVQIIVD